MRNPIPYLGTALAFGFLVFVAVTSGGSSVLAEEEEGYPPPLGFLGCVDYSNGTRVCWTDAPRYGEFASCNWFPYGEPDTCAIMGVGGPAGGGYDTENTTYFASSADGTPRVLLRSGRPGLGFLDVATGGEAFANVAMRITPTGQFRFGHNAVAIDPVNAEIHVLPPPRRVPDGLDWHVMHFGGNEVIVPAGTHSAYIIGSTWRPPIVTLEDGASVGRVLTHLFGGDVRFDAGVGFYGTDPVPQPTGVPVTLEGIHAALVEMGLIGE